MVRHRGAYSPSALRQSLAPVAMARAESGTIDHEYSSAGAGGCAARLDKHRCAPSWAYLYRRMLPVFIRAGGRVVAPDLFGFARSDKPAAESFYTFTRHREMLRAFIERLDLNRVTLVCQDWGGLLGLTLPPDMPQRFARAIVMNTTLGTGDAPLPEGFLAWRAWDCRAGVGGVRRVECRYFLHSDPKETA